MRILALLSSGCNRSAFSSSLEHYQIASQMVMVKFVPTWCRFPTLPNRGNICITLSCSSKSKYAVSVPIPGSWLKLWDTALDCGPEGTQLALAIHRDLVTGNFLYHHILTAKKCSLGSVIKVWNHQTDNHCICIYTCV